jgi:polysaccharide export outer membrane protein
MKFDGCKKAGWRAILLFTCALWILAPARSPLAATPANDDYRVGAGDLLRVAVFGYPDLAGDVRVSQSGNITYPLIGSVPVAGLSAREVETLLSQKLAAGHFIRESQVTVLVVEYQSQKVAVMGEVAKPGQYPLSASKRVLNLLADAGGVVTATAGDSATLIRADGTKIPIDLTAMLNGDATQNPVLSSGDTVNIPKAAIFYIYGEVQKPGAYKLERNMTVTQAISEAGGLTRRGSERGTIVKRHDASGKEIQTKIKGPELVKPNDILMIKESWF